MNTSKSPATAARPAPRTRYARVAALLAAAGLAIFGPLASGHSEPPADAKTTPQAQPSDDAPPPPPPPPSTPEATPPGDDANDKDRSVPQGRGRLRGGQDGSERAARIREWMSSDQGKATALERLERIREELSTLGTTIDGVIADLKAGTTPSLATLRPLLDRPLPSLSDLRERMALEGRGPVDRAGRGPQGREGERPPREGLREGPRQDPRDGPPDRPRDGPRDGRGAPNRGPEGRPVLTDEQRDRLIEFVREARPEFATLLSSMSERQPELVDRWMVQLAPRAIEAFELERRDPEMAELRKAELRASIEILDESFQVRQLANVENAPKERVDAAKARLREAIGRGFDARIKVRELETNRLERRVDETREAITKQRDTRDRVVDKVLSEMLGPLPPRPERRRPGETLDEEMRRAERESQEEKVKDEEVPAPKSPEAP